jgi:hypothetical protein
MMIDRASICRISGMKIIPEIVKSNANMPIKEKNANTAQVLRQSTLSCIIHS